MVIFGGGQVGSSLKCQVIKRKGIRIVMGLKLTENEMKCMRLN